MEHKRDTHRHIGKYIIPAIVVLFHIININAMKYHNMRIAAHWGSYVVLFIYILVLGEVKEVVKKIIQGLKKQSFVVGVFFCFLISFVFIMLFLLYASKADKPMYSMWIPLSMGIMPLWCFLYIFIQPLVDHIVYFKWTLGTQKGYSDKVWILIVVIIRTYIETGIFIYSKNSPIAEGGFLSVGYFVVSIIFSLSYYRFRNEGITYTGEVLYRISLVLVVFIGMKNLIPFIG